MARNGSQVAANRGYAVHTVSDAKTIVHAWLAGAHLENAVELGLPEVDDRYHIWRIPLVTVGGSRLGEVVITARTGDVDEARTTAPEVVAARLEEHAGEVATKPRRKRVEGYAGSALENSIFEGDAETVLDSLPNNAVDLVFTSPPYYNARPEYSDYVTYDEYLDRVRGVIRACHRVLGEGRFFVMNISPVLLRRENRNTASRRIAVPFDVHRLFIEEGYEFMEDIIWMKPEGAGWATNRGRRFAADRNPLQYKPVPVTEYVLVYRKKTDKLIDWNIRRHHDQDAVAASKIHGEYDTTNVWYIKPTNDRRHPAIFPVQLAERVVRYYSFRGDVVLDPYAGIGTTGRAAATLGRRFAMIERDPEYVRCMLSDLSSWSEALSTESVHCVNISPEVDPK
ncbi:MAG: site-specific DNA-methyltransferase [Actinomycetia bacterium]|nr:site-specific DNA-methyltransferase [Actinomycetes bacterium]